MGTRQYDEVRLHSCDYNNMKYSVSLVNKIWVQNSFKSHLKEADIIPVHYEIKVHKEMSLKESLLNKYFKQD